MKKYKFTGKVCNESLFIETFQTNPFGVDAEYLTDSLHFRKYIGSFDEEHERFLYTCFADSIRILKTVRGNRWAKWETTPEGRQRLISNLDTLENYTLNLLDLKKLNNYK
jgi:hypothetical protein